MLLNFIATSLENPLLIKHLCNLLRSEKQSHFKYKIEENSLIY